MFDIPFIEKLCHFINLFVRQMAIYYSSSSRSRLSDESAELINPVEVMT
jgi:hypothetical protein